MSFSYKNAQTFSYKNIPNIPDSVNSSKLETLKFWLSIDHSLPTYFINHSQKIHEFHNQMYNEDTLNALNNVGLHIYLNEPLTSYHTHDIVDMEGYGEFIGDENPVEFIGDEDPVELRAHELDSIETLISINKLTNVNVHTCDYDVEKYYPHYASKMKLLVDDRFVRGCFRPGHKPLTSLPPFNRKFINLNRRYTLHRELIVSYLNDKSSWVSWPHGESPKILDMAMEEEDNNNDFTSTSVLRELFEDSFVVVVNESRFAQPTANFSEKTLKAIIHHKPFILVAPPYTLKYLKEDYGFKTFSDFWDESYDEEEIHSERMKKIFALIDEIENKPLKELEEIYTQMKEIINYNIMRLSKLSFTK